ncbi:hypothetical protein GF420_08070 [candidate division GN15 bacterium]|nr:hypothetical protein [candidate division GN15 bacterium]
MTRNYRSISNLALILGVAMLTMVCVSCSDDSDPVSSTPQATGPIDRMEGVYSTNHRWGGASGAWRYNIEMDIRSNGEVYYAGTQITNPTMRGDSLFWSMSDGNATNAAMVFAESSSADFFWRDKGSVNKRCAMGWIQNPGEGPLDFRGLLK